MHSAIFSSRKSYFSRFIAILFIAFAPSLVNADDWQVSMGAGASYLPRYEGAAHNRLRLIPSLDINYHDGKFFISTSRGIGINFSNSKPIQYGIRVLSGLTRSESEDPRLYGTGNIDLFPEGSLFFSARLGPLSFSSSAANGEHGTHADVGGSLILPIGKNDRFRLAASQNWGDSNYNQTYFGITAAQALASGNVLTVYNAGEGVKDTVNSITWIHSFDQNWTGTINLTRKRFQGYSEASPLTERIVTDGIVFMLACKF